MKGSYAWTSDSAVWLYGIVRASCSVNKQMNDKKKKQPKETKNNPPTHIKRTGRGRGGEKGEPDP